MTSIGSDLPVGKAASLRSRLARGRRRRFLIMSVAALAILAAALGVSFTADTGTASFTITPAGTGNGHVFAATYAAGGLPTGVVGTATHDGSAWKYGTGSNLTTSVAPSWTPVAGTAGSVASGGDIAFIDASDSGSLTMTVSVYLTNMGDLADSYGSYAWPVELYCGQATGGTTMWDGSALTWALEGSKQYLTDTGGNVSWSVTTAANQFCEVTLDAGGSFYTISTADAAKLAPSFYVTADLA